MENLHENAKLSVAKAIVAISAGNSVGSEERKFSAFFVYIFRNFSTWKLIIRCAMGSENRQRWSKFQDFSRALLRSYDQAWLSAFAVHNSFLLSCLFHLFTFNICSEYSCMCKYFTSVACALNGLEGYLWAFISEAKSVVIFRRVKKPPTHWIAAGASWK